MYGIGSKSALRTGAALTSSFGLSGARTLGAAHPLSVGEQPAATP